MPRSKTVDDMASMLKPNAESFHDPGAEASLKFHWNGMGFRSMDELASWTLSIIEASFYDLEREKARKVSLWNPNCNIKRARWRRRLEEMLEKKALSSYLESIRGDKGMMLEVQSIEAQYMKNNGSDQFWAAIFWKLAYAIGSDIKGFFWMNRTFSDLEEFGRDMKLKLAQRENKSAFEIPFGYADMLRLGILSKYLSYIDADAETMETIKSFEDELLIVEKGKVDFDFELALNRLAFMLSDDAFFFDGKFFLRLEELIAYLEKALKKSLDSFRNLVERLISLEIGKPSPSFAVWMEALGKKEQLESLSSKFLILK
ncbi:MAG: hypothetical protein LBU32_09730 [Clostridiales bacterium]|jgi:hypothetical protein|nr:hypothetical protein [Clostridiales bacterium]